MADVRQRLLDELASSATLVSGLEREHADLVAASESSNADDEHDPEGATIAYERQQLAAVLEQARRGHADIEGALARLDGDSYGRCEQCGQAIAAERLEARPEVRTCIVCAAGGRS
jgi:RNA polymerase-binding transcription factor DksA